MRELQGERLKVARTALGLLSKTAAERLELSVSAYTDIEKGRNSLTAKVSTALISEFGINVNWILTGEGEMFLDLTEMPGKNLLVSAEQFKGYVNNESPLIKVIIPNIKGVARTFEIASDGMAPLLNYGDWVACLPMDDVRSLEDGRVFVVVTTSSEVLVGYGQSYKEGVKVMPHNLAGYTWQVIPYGQVYEVWQVRVRVTKYFMLPYMVGEMGGGQVNEPREAKG